MPVIPLLRIIGLHHVSESPGSIKLSWAFVIIEKKSTRGPNLWCFSFALTDYSFHSAYWHYSIRILVLQVFQNVKFSNTDRYAKCNTLVLARNMTGKIRIL